MHSALPRGSAWREKKRLEREAREDAESLLKAKRAQARRRWRYVRHVVSETNGKILDPTEGIDLQKNNYHWYACASDQVRPPMLRVCLQMNDWRLTNQTVNVVPRTT